jgi:hypothetical protein
LNNLRSNLRKVNNHTNTEEIWKPVVGYEGLYEVSNLGNVRSVDKVDRQGQKKHGRVRKLLLNQVGYLYVGISVENKKANLTVHRLVARAFIPNPDNKPQVNHIDGNKTNNIVSNLEWVTVAENTQHAYTTKLNKYKGENSHLAKLTEKQVIEIYDRLQNGEYQYRLAEEYGVNKTTISNIYCQKSWWHTTRHL